MLEDESLVCLISKFALGSSLESTLIGIVITTNDSVSSWDQSLRDSRGYYGFCFVLHYWGGGGCG